MTEPRIYADVELRVGEAATLPDPAYHHLIVVLRRVHEDKVTIFNGRGGEYGAAIESMAKKRVTVRVLEFRDVQRESPVPVTLAQAVSKGERMDFVMQKAVELGVTAIQPLLTDHVVVRLNEERWDRKLEHWQSIVVAACEQCGRTRVPKVAPVLDLRDWLNVLPPNALKLVLSPGVTPAGKVRRKDEPVMLLVGPEGGLSDMERNLVDITGFTALSLGPRILRTETAGVVALAMVQSLWGDLGSTLTP